MPAGHLQDNKVCAAQVVCCRDLCDAFFVAFVITERIRLVKPCIWSNPEKKLQLRRWDICITIVTATDCST